MKNLLRWGASRFTPPTARPGSRLLPVRHWTRRQQAPLWIGLAGLVAVGALVIGPLLRLPRTSVADLVGSLDGTTAVAAAQEPTTDGLQDEAARALFEQAERTSATDTLAAQRGLEQVRLRHPGGAWAERARLRLAELAVGRGSEAEIAFATLRARVLILSEWGEYQAAERLCADYLAAQSSSPWMDQVFALSRGIQQEAKSEYTRFRLEFQRLIAAREVEPARTLLTKAQTIFGASSLAQEWAADAAVLEQLSLREAQRKTAEDWATSLPTRCGLICDRARAFQYDAAETAARDLGENAARPGVEPKARALAQALLASVALERRGRTRLTAAINAKTGRATFIREGQVVSATAERITLHFQGGLTTLEILWSSLSTEEFLRVVQGQIHQDDLQDLLEQVAYLAHRRKWPLLANTLALATRRDAARTAPLQALLQLSDILIPVRKETP